MLFPVAQPALELNPPSMPALYPDLAGKAAVITGAGEGIGFAIARSLVHSGCDVVLNDVAPERAVDAARALAEEGPGRCAAVGGDAGDVHTVERIVATCVDEFGRLDFAIPNAGITLFGDFDEFTAEAFDTVMSVNLRGAFFLVQRASLAMREGGRGGRVVLMGSNVGFQAYPKLTAYAMTKAALRMMARNLVIELGPHRITINTLAPGATLTERTRTEQADYAAVWSELVPRGTIAEPRDIANACLFLLSEASAHVNGQTLVVDGGWSATSPLPAEAASEDVLTPEKIAAGVAEGDGGFGGAN